jgi:hypothetical protein
MCPSSFDKEALNITIHNQYPSLELVSPVCFSNGTTCHAASSQQTSTRNSIEASFGIDPKQRRVKGALLYKLQRKRTTGIDNHFNSNAISIENTATNIYLLVAWSIKGFSDDSFYVHLMECTNDFAWGEDKLWALYFDYNDQFYMDHKSNIVVWLMNDSTVMRTKLDITYGSDYKLGIALSEGTGKYDMKEPVKIDPERLVLSLPMLIVLTYTVSLSIQSTIKLNIHNQCLNVDLVSPTYITYEQSEFHRAPDYKICAGNTMLSAFAIDDYDFAIEPNETSYGVLIYRLQRKQSHESTEMSQSTSRAAHLLVVWRILNYKELGADVLLVEHGKKFIWSKNDLRKLYDKNTGRFRWFSYSATETWSLDDDVALMITSEIMDEDLVLDITISEVEERNYARIPAHIDMKR